MSPLQGAVVFGAAVEVILVWAPGGAALRRVVALLLVLLCAAQWLAEGFLWQLVPAYAVVALAAVAARDDFTHVRRVRWMCRVGMALFAVLLAMSWIALPVPALPAPTGPYAVGTHVFRWYDATRVEPATPDTSDRRAVVVQVWYPGTPTDDPSRVPYLDGVGRLPARVAGIPSAVFAHYDRIDTHASRSTRVNASRPRWPVVLFSPGYGASRAFYTTLVSDLASRGVIVLAVDHAYESALTALPDGRLVSTVERLLPTDTGRIQHMVRQTDVRRADMQAVLDALGDRTLFGALADHMDTSRVIATGHSFGGAASVELAATDPRVRAAANIDGTLYGATPDHRVQQPLLLVESDRAETGHGAWFLEGNARLLARARGPAYRCAIRRANHYSFTDAPLLLSAPARWLLSLLAGGSRGVPDTIHRTNAMLLTLLDDPAGIGALSSDGVTCTTTRPVP